MNNALQVEKSGNTEYIHNEHTRIIIIYTPSMEINDSESEDLDKNLSGKLLIFGGVLALKQSKDRLEAIEKLHTHFGTPEKFDAFMRAVTIQKRLIEIEEHIARTRPETLENNTTITVGATEQIRKRMREQLKIEKVELFGELGQLRVMNIIENLDDLLETILKALSIYQLRQKLDLLSEERYAADIQSVPEKVQSYILETFPRRDFQGTIERFFSLIPIEEALVHFLHYVSLSGAVSLETTGEDDPFFSALSASPEEFRQHMTNVLFKAIDDRNTPPVT